MISFPKKRSSVLFIAILVLAGCSNFIENEEEISFEQLPSNILNQAIQETDGLKIVKIEKSELLGKTEYSINYIKEGIEWEIVYDDDGKLVEKAIE